MARIDLLSPHSPVNAANRLKAAMEGVTPDTPRRVIGTGTEASITLWVHRPNFRNDFKTMLRATMEPHAGGTRIRGRIGAPRSVALFMLLWFGFVGAFLLFGLTMAFADGIGERLVSLPFVAIPALMLAMGAFMVWIGRRHGREDQAAILAFLHATLATRSYSARDL